MINRLRAADAARSFAGGGIDASGSPLRVGCENPRKFREAKYSHETVFGQKKKIVVLT